MTNINYDIIEHVINRSGLWPEILDGSRATLPSDYLLIHSKHCTAFENAAFIHTVKSYIISTTGILNDGITKQTSVPDF